MRTRQQLWAQKAYEKVLSVKGAGEGDYKRFCRGFPALLQASGLCQAISFVEAKGKAEHLQYMEHLAAVLGISREDLSKDSRSADISAYLRLSHDALSATGWLKRYAEALLEGDV